MSKIHPIVQRLLTLIEENDWRKDFDQAVASVHSYNIKALSHVKSFDDYINWINNLLYWKPTENTQGTNLFNHQNEFYFFLDQPTLLALQNKIVPEHKSPPLTPLSQWMVDYVNAFGLFLDSEESIDEETLQTFKDSPTFNYDEYLPPPSGYKTFNQFFARYEKPGTRPIAAMHDNKVIVISADSQYQGWQQINEKSTISSKGFEWSIDELFDNSPYRDRFKGGIFMHGWLAISDSHRLIAPVGGVVVESRVILGQVYREIIAQPVENSTTGEHVLKSVGLHSASEEEQNQLALNDVVGYQFAQARGLIVLDTPIGLVAILPVGMGFVSSVVMTADVGKTIYKGQEICYVQFGGSDHIVMFEAASCVNLTAQMGTAYQKGQVLGYAYPVLGG